VWEERHLTAVGQGVRTMAGAFNVVLGSIQPLGNSVTAFDKSYYIEASFKKEASWETFGRQQLISVPYALRAEFCSDMPVGSIIAWHKSFYNVLPLHWIECDGRVIPNDIGSPIGGMTTPNLNGTGRFLRGGSQSGEMQAQALKSHNHKVITGWLGSNRPEWHVVSDWTTGPYEPVVETSPGNGPSVTFSGEDETRPVNMKVVWIMKVK